jgi:hypothetical protein
LRLGDRTAHSRSMCRSSTSWPRPGSPIKWPGWFRSRS